MVQDPFFLNQRMGDAIETLSNSFPVVQPANQALLESVKDTRDAEATYIAVENHFLHKRIQPLHQAQARIEEAELTPEGFPAKWISPIGAPSAIPEWYAKDDPKRMMREKYEAAQLPLMPPSPPLPPSSPLAQPPLPPTPVASLTPATPFEPFRPAFVEPPAVKRVRKALVEEQPVEVIGKKLYSAAAKARQEAIKEGGHRHPREAKMPLVSYEDI